MDLEYRRSCEKRLKDKDKIIIPLGDSFTRGEGACDLEFGRKYNWDWYYNNYDITQKNEISKTFYDNSWVHQLCYNHMDDYEPLNLGLTGRGNRATIKELYLCPEMKLHEKKEIIVIFMLTGMERFDFFQGDFDENAFSKPCGQNWMTEFANNPDKNLWESYFKHVWSDRFSIMEMLMNVEEVKTWCLSHNAKLMLTSAFRPDYQKNEFLRLMNKESNSFIKTNQHYINYLIDMFDWENFIRPYGHRCITDFLCYLEDRTDLIIEDLFGLSSKFYEFAYSNKELSPKGFVTNCAHPSKLGNSKIAEMFFENIKNNKFINLQNPNEFGTYKKTI